jgi:putative restriction endonuclease
MESSVVQKTGREKRHFGHIPGVSVGTIFKDRRALAAAGVHRPLQAGISGSEKEGADSIVLSGGYEDDKDSGDVIIYTGHGGNDPGSGKQVGDQELTRGNRALAKTYQEGLPVRVIRGAGLRSPLSPENGYRYDGLYIVESYRQERGQSGYNVWRFRLARAPE